MWSRTLLKTNAKENLKRNYWICVLVPIIAIIVDSLCGGIFRILDRAVTAFIEEGTSVYIISLLVIGVINFLSIFLVTNILEVGEDSFFLKNRSMKGHIENLFDGFKLGYYGNIVKIMFLMELYLALWTCLFIIPGIIKLYEYRMVPYILAERSDINHKEAFALSRSMMDGQKLDVFILDLSFIGWGVLSIFTCGIVGIFWAIPYKAAANAELYAFNKNNMMENAEIGRENVK